MSLTYGVVCIIALILIGVCIAIDRRKEIWLLLLFISVFVCNLGYFLLSESKTLSTALASNRIAYFGNVFLPFFMFMIILSLCRIKCRKWFYILLLVISVMIFGIAASPGYLTVYYKAVSIEMENGVTRLVREYGPLHILYYIYLFLYFMVMLSVIGYSIAKKKIASHVHGVFLLFAVLINIVVWFIEQFLPREFEFLSVSYIISEALILFLYGIFQQYNMKQRIICVWAVAFACVGIALLCKAVPSGSLVYVFLNLVRSFIYAGAYYAWGRIVCHGIIQKTQRRCLGGISALLVFWIVVSGCKHFVFSYHVTIVRYLWYAYYIPQILIVALSLITVRMAGKGEDVRPGKESIVLFGGAFALILLVFTNDLHQLVFSFPEGEPWTNDSCTHEFGYYLIMALMALCSIGALVRLMFKCRVPGRRRLVGFPFTCLSLMIAYAVLYFVEGSFVDTYLNDMTAASCLMIAALFESLIESGLLRTNMGYAYLFQSSGLAAQITDSAHQVCYVSERAGSIPPETLAAADEAPVMLDPATRMSGAAIRNGHIYWQEDVTELLAVQEKLELTQEELRDIGEVLKTESAQEAYRLQLKVKNRLYDLVEEQTAPQIAMLRELTARLGQAEDLDEAKRLLGKIIIIGTYVKRSSNLIFVAVQEQSISTGELLLGMNESMENLRLYGVDCGVQILGSEKLSLGIANMVYDIFEAVIEKGLDTFSSILLYMEPQDDRFFLTICTDCAEDLSTLCQSFPHITVWQDEDGVWYLNRMIKKSEGGGT